MNRNQKIALGCGGAGCLGLIVVAIAGCVIYFVYYSRARPYSANSNYNFNVSTNRNSNTNDNSDLTSNANDNYVFNVKHSSSMSDDDKHKLYQAATMTGDQELIRRVSVKIGLMDDDFTPGANIKHFVAAHVDLGGSQPDFIQSINTPEKARDYVNENFPD